MEPESAVTETKQPHEPDTMLMPAEQFDTLVASLDEPDPAPGLARAVARAVQADQRMT